MKDPKEWTSADWSKWQRQVIREETEGLTQVVDQEEGDEHE